MKKLAIFFLSCCCLAAAAQSDAPSLPVRDIAVKRTTQPIKIDGDLSDPAWAAADSVGGFWKQFPVDDTLANFQTLVRVLYDQHNLYVSFVAYDEGKRFITSLRRDVGDDDNDGVGLILDPLNEKANGFFFVLNAFGTQSEGLLGAQSDNADFTWDNRWYTATKQQDRYWTAEMAIPFKTLRYKPDRREWAINFSRVDMHTNQVSAWNRVPLNFDVHDLGYMGRLLWPEPPPAPGANVAFIPYVVGQGTTAKQDSEGLRGKANTGFDAKIALGTALNLDLTVNPDFAQAEVDRQVTNLTRFNIFFPERRNFFLENADLFSNFGIGPIRPFYSRRIGLDRNGRPIPIIGGARLTGNLGKTTRIGVLNMQTGRTDDYSPENYTAVAVSQKVFTRSFVRGYVLNRQAFMTEAEKRADPLQQYGRNAGIELTYSDAQGKWQGWTTYHHSYKPGISNENKYISAGGGYFDRKFEGLVDFGSIGTNFYTDMGFLERIENYDALRDTTVRLGYKSVYAEATYRFFPKSGSVNQHNVGVENFSVVNPDGSFNEHNLSLSYEVQFKNTAAVSYSYNFNTLHLRFPVSFTDGVPLPAKPYAWGNHNLSFNSDIRKPFNASVSLGAGSFYNGRSAAVESQLTYRSIPHFNLSMGFNYYRLRFPQPYGKSDLFLIAPQVDINFSTTVFWTTFLQFNTQGNNVNINSRFQWRFKPMSDLFLVYTDNYFTTPFLKNKNRALVLKGQWWLNL